MSTIPKDMGSVRDDASGKEITRHVKEERFHCTHNL